jgi:hypothetical protein
MRFLLCPVPPSLPSSSEKSMTVLPLPWPCSTGLSRKIDMRPSASACVRSAPAIVVLESARLAMEQSNTTAPLPPLSASPVFGRLRRSGGSKAASHGGLDITLYPNCITWDKDGLDPPHHSPSAGARRGDAFPPHGAIEADADRGIRHRLDHQTDLEKSN